MIKYLLSSFILFFLSFSLINCMENAPQEKQNVLSVPSPNPPIILDEEIVYELTNKLSEYVNERLSKILKFYPADKKFRDKYTILKELFYKLELYISDFKLDFIDSTSLYLNDIHITTSQEFSDFYNLFERSCNELFYTHPVLIEYIQHIVTTINKHITSTNQDQFLTLLNELHPLLNRHIQRVFIDTYMDEMNLKPKAYEGHSKNIIDFIQIGNNIATLSLDDSYQLLNPSLQCVEIKTLPKVEPWHKLIFINTLMGIQNIKTKTNFSPSHGITFFDSFKIEHNGLLHSLEKKQWFITFSTREIKIWDKESLINKTPQLFKSIAIHGDLPTLRIIDTDYVAYICSEKILIFNTNTLTMVTIACAPDIVLKHCMKVTSDLGALLSKDDISFFNLKSGAVIKKETTHLKDLVLKLIHSQRVTQSCHPFYLIDMSSEEVSLKNNFTLQNVLHKKRNFRNSNQSSKVITQGNKLFYTSGKNLMMLTLPTFQEVLDFKIKKNNGNPTSVIHC